MSDKTLSPEEQLVGEVIQAIGQGESLGGVDANGLGIALGDQARKMRQLVAVLLLVPGFHEGLADVVAGDRQGVRGDPGDVGRSREAADLERPAGVTLSAAASMESNRLRGPLWLPDA